MIPFIDALKRTGHSLKDIRRFALSWISDVLFLFIFGWAFGILLMSKTDEFLQALQIRLIESAGAVSGESIEPTFFSDMLSYDPMIKETMISFVVFMLYSAVIFFCLYACFQSISWYFAHRMAGNSPDLLRFIRKFMVQSTIILAILFVLQGISLLHSINSVLSSPERGVEIARPVWLSVGYAGLIIAATSLYSVSNQTFRRGASFLFRRFPIILISFLSIALAFYLLSLFNGILSGAFQFLFQLCVIVPLFTIIRVFFICLAKDS